MNGVFAGTPKVTKKLKTLNMEEKGWDFMRKYEQTFGRFTAIFSMFFFFEYSPEV